MKPILAYVALALVLTACEKDQPPAPPSAPVHAPAPVPPAAPDASPARPERGPEGPESKGAESPPPPTLPPSKPPRTKAPAPEASKDEPKDEPKPAPQGRACRSDKECAIVCVRAPCPTGVCRDGHCGTTSATSACATMLCKKGTRCVDDGKRARCVATTDDASACRPTGCSGSVCSDEEVMTTCEYRPEYACYQNATCARQRDGNCGWTQTPELARCLESGGAAER